MQSEVKNSHSVSLNYSSCGKREFTSIPLSELTNAYDVWIWLQILSSSISISIPLLSVSLFEYIFHLMSPLKAFLEQGDPFSKGDSR